MLLSSLIALSITLAADASSFRVQKPVDGFDDVKVPIVLGVMSKCPDAVICETMFEHVMKRVGNKVDISLSFIGAINASEPDFGVTCKHGRDECVGNVQQLCAAKYSSQESWWHFVQCQNTYGHARVGEAALTLACAKSVNIPWEGSSVGRCAGDDASGVAEEGIQLLKESVLATQALGIQNSCTIMMSGQKVCVHDGEWKDCEHGHKPEDFIREIDKEYRRLNSEGLDD